MEEKIEITIPLSFEKKEYIVRLEPLPRISEIQEFIVTMKCKRTFSISNMVFYEIKQEDIPHLIETEVEYLLRTCLKMSIPEEDKNYKKM
jgi:hypothetical protein